ncbi:hypothetical protein N0V90_001742 [Kalmusia sp. IMI 367209]|nr:hypothetical protein N0V90_001742 [Kalmusia sp. IMI 367209]
MSFLTPEELGYAPAQPYSQQPVNDGFSDFFDYQSYEADMMKAFCPNPLPNSTLRDSTPLVPEHSSHQELSAEVQDQSKSDQGENNFKQSAKVIDREHTTSVQGADDHDNVQLNDVENTNTTRENHGTESTYLCGVDMESGFLDSYDYSAGIEKCGFFNSALNDNSFTSGAMNDNSFTSGAMNDNSFTNGAMNDKSFTNGALGLNSFDNIGFNIDPFADFTYDLTQERNDFNDTGFIGFNTSVNKSARQQSSPVQQHASQGRSASASFTHPQNQVTSSSHGAVKDVTQQGDFRRRSTQLSLDKTEIPFGFSTDPFQFDITGAPLMGHQAQYQSFQDLSAPTSRARMQQVPQQPPMLMPTPPSTKRAGKQSSPKPVHVLSSSPTPSKKRSPEAPLEHTNSSKRARTAAPPASGSYPFGSEHGRSVSRLFKTKWSDMTQMEKARLLLPIMNGEHPLQAERNEKLYGPSYGAQRQREALEKAQRLATEATQSTEFLVDDDDDDEEDQQMDREAQLLAELATIQAARKAKEAAEKRAAANKKRAATVARKRAEAKAAKEAKLAEARAEAQQHQQHQQYAPYKPQHNAATYPTQ